MKAPFSTIEEAIEDIRQGKMVVVCDDENRENEGDLTMAAQFVTPEAINFMAKEGRGLICLALTPDRCDELGLDLMAAKNESAFETAFTVSIEARTGVSTGISAADRARTIQVAIDPKTSPRELVQPGHVFPLKAKAGGVLERVGQTEAGVDLSRLAGLIPASVICEVMNDDGSMARVPDLEQYCQRHELKMITVADLVAYRRRHEKLVERVVATKLPTGFGDFVAVGYRSLVDNKHHVALVKGDVDGVEDVLVRVHSECLTGDVFHSLRCDCGEQLESALAMIEQRGSRRAALPEPGGPRHRAAQQAPRVQAPGGGSRHRRREPPPGPAGRPARLRHRRADPRRPRAHVDPDPHEQPEEDLRSRRLRAVGQRPDPDPARRQSPQRGVSARQAREAWPHAAPPGAGARRGDDPPRAVSRIESAMPDGAVALCVATFYDELAGKLEAGAREALDEVGVAEIDRFEVPGAFELPIIAKYAAESGRYVAIVCLGAVIRGETDHYDYVCGETARGVQQVQLATGVPCGFGVLTVDNMEQALRARRRRLQARHGPARGRGGAGVAGRQGGAGRAQGPRGVRR